jgi:hypothetical protein
MVRPKGATNVRFGSLADICSAKGHVRFTPNSDGESGFPQTVMSALPLKADMCSALGHVCFGPKADILGLIRLAGRRAQGAAIDRGVLIMLTVIPAGARL